jgi:hypothetical protein
MISKYPQPYGDYYNLPLSVSKRSSLPARLRSNCQQAINGATQQGAWKAAKS